MVLCSGGSSNARSDEAVTVVENEEIKWEVVSCVVHENEGVVAQK